MVAVDSLKKPNEKASCLERIPEILPWRTSSPFPTLLCHLISALNSSALLTAVQSGILSKGVSM